MWHWGHIRLDVGGILKNYSEEKYFLIGGWTLDAFKTLNIIEFLSTTATVGVMWLRSNSPLLLPVSFVDQVFLLYV
ncbi:unnamed protein product [Hymenolepis diminuta]|uniref:Uncharacterized protein n=1 Tax=Hymenolepis diminuta TaxID=6216 RepID=A0A564YEG2_HYMDI|nr:unnamed protein product [Hymenolepis diminuta]